MTERFRIDAEPGPELITSAIPTRIPWEWFGTGPTTPDPTGPPPPPPRPSVPVATDPNPHPQPTPRPGVPNPPVPRGLDVTMVGYCGPVYSVDSHGVYRSWPR